LVFAIQLAGFLAFVSATLLGMLMIVYLFLGRRVSNTAVGLAKILLPFILIFGAALLFYGRITELSYGNYKIKTQAESDADTIAALKVRVEAQAATIDLVAQKASEVGKLITDLRTYRDFFSVYISAHNDDRKAFEQLKVWAEDPGYPLSKDADASWRRLVFDANDYLVFKIPPHWPDNVDPSRLPMSEIRTLYATCPQHERSSFVSYVWSRKDISMEERMAFLADVMRYDSSLGAVEQAGFYFALESKDGFRALEITGHLKWWEEHKDSYQ
jgi:hypothetical protein